MKKYLTNNIFSRIAILICITTISIYIQQQKIWLEQDPYKGVISWDVVSYYSYLPATFIYGDVTLNNPNQKYNEFHHIFWPTKLPNNKKVYKTSMGMSFLYAPFFFLGHITAYMTGYEPSGFTNPYKIFILISALFYVTIGLIFLRKILLRYFKDNVVTITILIIIFGTSLLHYSTKRAMITHSYNFSLITIFLWLVIKWYENSSIANTIKLSLLFGLITLIRPSNIVVFLLFIFYDIKSFTQFKERILLFIRNYHLIFIMIFCFLLVWFPQMLYWHKATGQWFFYSYVGEKFYFNDPAIIRGLFSYRNGWLLYNPNMIFALMGIYFLFVKKNIHSLSILIYVVISTYIILSWWCWWYPGFANRAFVDLYGILAIPLAAFISFVLSSRLFIKITGIIIFVLLTSLSVFQTWQYANGLIHYCGMTKESYWINFLKTEVTLKYYKSIREPDIQEEMKNRW